MTIHVNELRNLRCTVTELAALFGLSRETMGKHVKALGLHGEKRGERFTYSPAAYHAAVLEQREATLRERYANPAIQESQSRLMAATAELKELELVERRGELATKTAVQQAWSRAMERVDAKLRNITSRSAVLFGAKSQADLTARLERVVEEAREELRERAK